MKLNKEEKTQVPVVRRLDWWESLTLGERKLICNLMRMLRGAKQSELRDVAIAAAKWERGIGCFIKVRLMNGASRTCNRRASLSISVKPVTSSPSTSRSQRGVSPNQG